MEDILTLLKGKLNLNSKSTLVVSVSGGIDSMVLLSILQNSSFPLAVVHFNHQKREESVVEAHLVEDFCKENSLAFHYYTLEIPAGNFHNQAHHLRNHYLKEVARLYKTPYILTAHHLDDLFENILIKLTRGSNLLGYAGMQQVHRKSSFYYIKPLLYKTKDEITDYASKHQVPYLSDQSNEENFYLRNRYRHAVVPIMKQENETLLEQIKQYHQQVSEAFKYIRSQTKAFLNDQENIDIGRYQTLDEALQDDVIAFLIEINKLPFNYRMIQLIKEMLNSKKPNQSYPLSNRYSFHKSYQTASITQIKPVAELRIELKEGETKFENVAIFTFFDDSSLKPADFTKLCYNKLAFPLWVRHREDGDLLSYSYGHKKLKKLLIDLKVPTEKRKRLWVVVDNDDNILWIPGYYVNQTLGIENDLYFQLLGA